jgi:hypothetical protein
MNKYLTKYKYLKEKNETRKKYKKSLTRDNETNERIKNEIRADGKSPKESRARKQKY